MSISADELQESFRYIYYTTDFSKNEAKKSDICKEFVYTENGWLEREKTYRKGVNMKKIAVFFAEGYEEIEALTVVDLCRRAGIDTQMVSVTGKKVVTGSHGIGVEMDVLFEEVDVTLLDMIVLPGGMPGTLNLEAHEGLMNCVDAFFAEGKGVAAICAAPSILGHRGILKGRKACSYPGFEKDLEGALVVYDNVAVSEQVITSRGMGCAIDFSLAIIELLCDKTTADSMAQAIIYR